MKNTKLSLMAAVLFLMAAFTSCEDVLPTMKPSEVEKEAILVTLGNNSQLSEFAEALKDVDFSKIQGSEFTVFAVKNGGMSKSALKSDDGSNAFDVMRHIVAGNHPKSSLANGQTLTALDGSELTVTVTSGASATGSATQVYKINGVELGSETVAGNSVVFTVNEAIPATAPNTGGEKYTVTFHAGDGVFANGNNTKTVQVEAGKTVKSQMETPTRTEAGVSYAFDGWLVNYSEWHAPGDFDVDTPINGDLNLFAKWTQGGGNPQIVEENYTFAQLQAALNGFKGKVIPSTFMTATWFELLTMYGTYTDIYQLRDDIAAEISKQIGKKVVNITDRNHSPVTSSTPLAIMLIYYESAGGSTTTKLSAPTNLQVDTSSGFAMLKWDAVGGATGYIVKVGASGTEIQQSPNQYPLYTITTPGTHTIYVQAMGDGTNYSNSDAASYSYTVGDNGGGTPTTKDYDLLPILQALNNGTSIPSTVQTWTQLLPVLGRYASLPALVNAVKAYISEQEGGATVTDIKQIGATSELQIDGQTPIDTVNGSTRIRAYFE